MQIPFRCRLSHLITPLVVLGSVLCSPTKGADPQAIQEVASGKRTEAKAAWWGFDPADSTAALQAAIRSGARRVIVENLGAPWVVDKIQLASDQEIVFAPGVVVQAKRGAFHGKTDALFSASGCSSVTLTGPGATLKMWKEDYVGPDYAKSEWRHTLAFRSCTNVRVTGLTLADSGGDGIYLGASRPAETNRHVQISDVVFRNHHRQGISVISAEDLLIERCALLDTGGTAPQSGIDFEPNDPENRLVNCVMRDCRSENNRGYAYVFALPRLHRSSPPLSIRLERCTSVGCRESVAFITGNAEAESVTGTVDFVDCRFEGAEKQAIAIERKPAAGCKVRFTHCAIVNPAQQDASVAPIAFGSTATNSEDIGGVEFADCTITDAIDRRPLSFVDPVGELRLADVTGSLRVIHDGKTIPYDLGPTLLSGWFPAPNIRKFPKVTVDVAKLQPAVERSGATDWPIHARVRESASWLVWATAGAEVSLTIRIQALGKQEVHDVPIHGFSPNGEGMKLSVEGSPAERVVHFHAGATGAYRITCAPQALTAQLLHANAPACLFPEGAPLHLVSTTGEFHFWVPAGVSALAVKLAGGGGTERVKAVLLEPNGKVRDEKDNIDRAAQFAVDLPHASRGEVWTLKLARPSQGVMEDFTVLFQGIPPLLAASPDALLRMKP